MRKIKPVEINEVITPSEPLPTNAKLIVFNGTEYVIYEEGDELPPEPVYEQGDELPVIPNE